MPRKNRLVRVSRARQSHMHGPKSDNIIEGTSKIDDEYGSRHSAESKFAQVSVTQPGNVVNATSGVAGVPLPVIEAVVVQSTTTRRQPKGQDNANQTSKGNRTGRRSDFRILMYQAAMRGDWQAAEVLLRLDSNVGCVEITERGDRALHVAAAIKHTKFVKELVNWMDPHDLELPNTYGQTAFSYAAASGIVEIADAMREKNNGLVTIRDKNNMTPLYIAALLRNTDMVSYLYKFTPVEDLSTEEWFDLLLAAIKNNMYDVAIEILKKNRSLATTKRSRIALHLLAQQDISGIDASQEAIFERFVTIFAVFPCLSWVKRIFEQPLMRNRARELAEKLCAEIDQRSGDYIDEVKLINKRPILHDAAKVGNVGFITMLARNDPDLLFKMDDKGRTIFHISVLHRQEHVFILIHQIGAMKDLIAISTDNDGNNILHLAAKLAPSRRRKIVPGAALQMQRELLWFKEVEKIVPRDCLEMKNIEGFRPRVLFSRKHQELLKEAEEWMKKTAESCMLMATLIATVVFAAAFTVPGGNNDETGSPIFLKRSWFTVFVVSDAVAMFSSTFSIIMFLSILTSRYQEDDFLVSLPAKLFLGLTSLFASIVSTMIAFTSTFFLLFTKQREWAARWIAGFSCASLVALFVALYLKLWVDTIKSTYLSRFMFRPGKHSLY